MSVFRILHLTSLLIVALVTSCSDLVQESDSSKCNRAINRRLYEKALEICQDRVSLATAYMGLSGFDLVSFVDASDRTVEAITDETVIAALGEEKVAGESVLNFLGLSVTDIENAADRRTAIGTSKLNMEAAITLLSPMPAEDMTADERFLEVFASIFALQLEILLLVDVGKATTFDPLASTIVTDITTEITEGFTDGSITDASDLATFHQITETSEGVAFEEGVLRELDGRVWDKEQNMALLPSVVQLDAVTQLLLGATAADIGGNLTNLCNSFRSTGASSTTTDPTGFGILSLSLEVQKAIAKLPGSGLGDNDVTASADESKAEADRYLAVFDDACANLDNL